MDCWSSENHSHEGLKQSGLLSRGHLDLVAAAFLHVAHLRALSVSPKAVSHCQSFVTIFPSTPNLEVNCHLRGVTEEPAELRGVEPRTAKVTAAELIHVPIRVAATFLPEKDYPQEHLIVYVIQTIGKG
jgi:hypothetical protein